MGFFISTVEGFSTYLHRSSQNMPTVTGNLCMSCVGVFFVQMFTGCGSRCQLHSKYWDVIYAKCVFPEKIPPLMEEFTFDPPLPFGHPLAVWLLPNICFYMFAKKYNCDTHFDILFNLSRSMNFIACFRVTDAARSFVIINKSLTLNNLMLLWIVWILYWLYFVPRVAVANLEVSQNKLENCNYLKFKIHEQWWHW